MLDELVEMQDYSGVFLSDAMRCVSRYSYEEVLPRD